MFFLAADDETLYLLDFRTQAHIAEISPRLPPLPEKPAREGGLVFPFPPDSLTTES